MARKKILAKKRKQRKKPTKPKIKEMPPKLGRSVLVGCRWYISSYHNLMNKLKPLMSNGQKLLLQGSYFSPLLNLPKIKQERPLLDDILGLWDQEQAAFRIGGKFYKFRAEDVAIILGFPLKGEDVNFKQRGASKIREKYFGGGVHKKNVEDVLLRLVRLSNVQEEQDFVKILILYTLGTVLFPNTEFTIPSFLFKYIDEPLEKIHNLSWPRAIHRYVSEKIPRVAHNIQMRNNGEKSEAGYLRGCVCLLCIWFLELTKMERPSNYGTFPRILNWGNIKSRRRRGFVEQIIDLPNGQVLDCLVPEIEEQWLIHDNKEAMGSLPQETYIGRAHETSGLWRRHASSRNLVRYYQEIQRRKKVRAQDNIEAENQSLLDSLQKKHQELIDTMEQMKREHQSQMIAWRAEREEMMNKIQRMEEVVNKQVEGVSTECVAEVKEETNEMMYKEEGKEGKETFTQSSITRRVKTNPRKRKKKQLSIPRGVNEGLMLEGKEKKKRLNHDEGSHEKTFNFAGMEKLNEDEVNEINMFLSSKMDRVWDNGRSYVLSKYIHDLIFGMLIIDDVLDVFMAILQESSQSKLVYFLRPYLQNKISSQSYSLSDADMVKLQDEIKEGTKLFIIPLFTNMHWHLLTVSMEHKEFSHYNSCKGASYSSSARQMMKWFASFLSSHFNMPEAVGWQLREIMCPQQDGGSDCAIFVMHFMECIVRGEEINVQQSDIALLRGQYAARIIRDGRLRAQK